MDEFQRSLLTPEEPLNVEFRCALCFTDSIEFNSQLPNAVRAATLTAATVRAPVDLLVAAGQLIALAVLAAVAVFSLERRKAEATLMNARGAGPGQIGAIAVLESLLPILAGLVIGLGLGYAAIALLGPGGTVERGRARRVAAARRPARAASRSRSSPSSPGSPSRGSSGRATTTTARSRFRGS